MTPTERTEGPLPPDYLELTSSGQRLARVAAVSKQNTPEDLVMAWSFMRSYYLRSSDSGWYNPPTYDSPMCHYRFIDNVGRYARNCLVFPRSYAKSFLSDELLMTWCLGRGRWSVLVVKSRDDLMRHMFMKIMRQLSANQRIIDDFGSLRPKRGEGIWSTTRLWLSNGFQLIGRAISGQLLGPRTNFVMIDDAEYDPVLQDCPTDKSDQLRTLYYNHILPVVEAGGGVLLTGTLFRQNTFIYYVASTDVSEDPSLAYWNREVWAIYDGDPSRPTWPDKYPQERIIQLMDEYPPAAFSSQFLNKPATEEATPLRLHPDFGWYTVKDIDQNYFDAPFMSSSVLVSHLRKDETDNTPQRIERPYGKTVEEMYRIIVADPIRKPSSTSDYACVMTIGIENSDIYRDTWWLLDIKLGRASEAMFLEWIWEMGEKWRPRVVGIESLAHQKALTEAAVTMYEQRSASSGWAPRIFPITYKGEMGGDRGKPRRISNLTWRFDYNKIKAPKHLAQKRDWKELFHQISNFTGDLALLRFDDAIDTLAMVPYVVRPLGSTPMVDTAPQSIEELLESGEYYLPDKCMGVKVPIIWAVDPSSLTPAQMKGLDTARHREDKRRKRSNQRKTLTRRARVSKKRSLYNIGQGD